MKYTIGIFSLAICLVSCNMNPNKEARLQELEAEAQRSAERMDELESKVESLQEANQSIRTKVTDLEQR